MSKQWGIPYQGSKSGIAEDLIKILPKGNRFVDLFGGGFAMSEIAMYSGKYNYVLYNELNPLLPKLVKKAINGDYSYDKFKPKFITREEFNKNKEKDGYIKYVWSFSNGGTSYLFGKDIEKEKESIHNFVVFGEKDEFIKYYFNDIDNYVKGNDIKKRRLLLRRYIESYEKLIGKKQLEQLQRLQQLEQLQRLERLQQLQQLERLEIVEGSYLDYKYQDGDVVFCDPPYEGTAKYNNNSSFNHKEFYNWVASRPYQVYFTSYNNISDDRFIMVWAKGKRDLMCGASGNYNYEVLYTNR